MRKTARKKIIRSDIMKAAWELARFGAKKFGGSAKEYLAEALKIVWKRAKTLVNVVFTDENGRETSCKLGFVAEDKGFELVVRFSKSVETVSLRNVYPALSL